MLSMILLEADANKIALSHADHVAIGQIPVFGHLVTVDPDASLLGRAASLAGALREAGLEKRGDQFGPAGNEVGDLARLLALAKPAVPLGLGGGRRVGAVEALDEAPSDCRLCVTRVRGPLV